MIRGILSFAVVALSFCSAAHAQARNKIDCNAQFQFSQRTYGVKADILKKVGLEVNVDAKVQAALDNWTTLALQQMRALCDTYKRNTEATFSTQQYLQELDRLRAWEMGYAEKIILSNIKLCEAQKAAATAGNKGSSSQELADAEKQVKEALTELTEASAHPPKPNIKKGPLKHE
jgi:hypothetical protein